MWPMARSESWDGRAEHVEEAREVKEGIFSSCCSGVRLALALAFGAVSSVTLVIVQSFSSRVESVLAARGFLRAALWDRT